MLDVPAPTENRNDTNGAISVICFGRDSINLAAMGDHPVDTTGRLHHRRREDDGQDDEESVDRRTADVLSEDEHEDGNTCAAPQTESDTARSGTHDNRPEHYRQLEDNLDCFHQALAFSITRESL